jgi:hypothetical protein
MDIQSWKAAWTVFMGDPIPFSAAVLILCGFVWWFRGFLLKERMAVKDERLEKAKEEAERFAAKLVQAETRMEQLIRMNTPAPQLSATAASTASIFGELKEANTALQTTLAKPRGLLWVLDDPEWNKTSSTTPSE